MLETFTATLIAESIIVGIVAVELKDIVVNVIVKNRKKEEDALDENINDKYAVKKPRVRRK